METVTAPRSFPPQRWAGPGWDPPGKRQRTGQEREPQGPRSPEPPLLIEKNTASHGNGEDLTYMFAHMKMLGMETETHVHIKTRIRKFIAALFTVAKHWTPPT